ncbi:DUF262 domain-containing protein [Arthrobacter sp. TB 23]|uniref:DUF262 domain-containing protein n=1 Tax=Arthrobacter sp. TB 23 TaxID=494419 RepID=UPI00178C454D|nr:DUF262 domain-containing protein [Arthrobacter sp. TB 23]
MNDPEEFSQIRGAQMATLQNDTINIGRLFGPDFFFSIPNYQRPFSWDKDNLSDLIDDLIAAKRDSDYFLGTLVLHQTSENNFDVVDGQQRLTALSILLACLRDHIGGNPVEIQELLMQPERTFAGIPARVRLSVRDSAPYHRIVCTHNGTRAASPAPSILGSTERRYLEATGIFSEKLAELSVGELQGLAEFIIRRVVVIYLAANTFDDAFRLFTVVNDRGKQLRRIDILKAANLSPSAISDPSVRDEYARKWEDLEEGIGEAEFESLFHSLRLIYVQEKPEGDLLHEFDTRIFSKPNRPTRGTNFINTLETYVNLYESLFVTRDFMIDTDYHAKYKTLTYSMISEYRANEWRACILLYAMKYKQAGMYQFLLKLEQMYLGHWVNSIRKDERYSSYTLILKSIESSKFGRAVAENIEPNTEAIRDACKNANFYGTGYAKYLLLRAEIASTELDSPREFTARSIEHVLPQSPAPDSEWKSTFSQSEIDELVHNSGNLVLLSRSKNSSAQNKDFELKRNTYLKPRISEYPRSLQAVAETEWTPKVIRERTKSFAALAVVDI